MKKMTQIGEGIDESGATQTPNQATPTVPTERGSSQKANKLSRLAQWLLPVGISIVSVVLLIATQSLWLTQFRSPSATSPKSIPYQGRLTDPNGIPLTGKFNMTFRLYGALTGGTPLWEEDRTAENSVQVSDGLVNVMLGSINKTLPSVIAGHDEVYLGITVGNDIELSPRVPLASVPYSMQASDADTVDGLHASDLANANHSHSALDAPDGTPVEALFVDNEGDVGIGTTQPAATLDVNGSIKFGGRIISQITYCTFNGTENSNGRDKWHYWVAGECDNGLPQGNCIGFLTKIEQCGHNQDWKVVFPGENDLGGIAPNGGMRWLNDNSCGNLNIAATYFCSE